MSLVIVCARCKRRLDAWPVDRCPACGCDPHAARDDDAAEWEAPHDSPPPEPGWEDADVVEE